MIFTLGFLLGCLLTAIAITITPKLFNAFVYGNNLEGTKEKIIDEATHNVLQNQN